MNDPIKTLTDIAAAITLIMSAIVGLAHGLVWLAAIVERLAALTPSKSDDGAAHRFTAFAATLSRGADWLAAQHARLMPAKSGGDRD